MPVDQTFKCDSDSDSKKQIKTWIDVIHLVLPYKGKYLMKKNNEFLYIYTQHTFFKVFLGIINMLILWLPKIPFHYCSNISFQVIFTMMDIKQRMGRYLSSNFSISIVNEIRLTFE